MEERVFIGLGSNVGDRMEFLQNAVTALGATKAIHVNRCSFVYETEPVGHKDQPPFFNAVAEIQTTLEPQALFAALKEIELGLGRVRRERWHEREIDLDILYFGARTIRSPELIVPHAERANRKFVLVPLSDVAEDFIDPAEGASVKTFLAQCKDSSSIRKLHDGKLSIA